MEIRILNKSNKNEKTDRWDREGSADQFKGFKIEKGPACRSLITLSPSLLLSFGSSPLSRSIAAAGGGWGWDWQRLPEVKGVAGGDGDSVRGSTASGRRRVARRDGWWPERLGAAAVSARWRTGNGAVAF